MASSRDTIYQKIALQGDSAIKEALAGIGAAGEKAFAALKNAAENNGAAASFAKLGSSLDNLKLKIAAVGAVAQKLGPQFQSFTNNFGAAGNAFKTVELRATLLTAAVTAAYGAFALLSKGAADAADAAGKEAQKVGLSVEDYSRLNFAAQQTKVSTEDLSTGLRNLDKAIVGVGGGLKGVGDKVNQFGVSVVDGSGDLSALGDIAASQGVEVLRFGDAAAKAGDKTVSVASAFKALGVNVIGANGRLKPTLTIIEDIADAFAKLQDGAQKTDIARALFGKTGNTLIPLLNGGSKAIRAFAADSDLLQRTITKAEAEAGDAESTALDRFGLAIDGLKNKVALAFGPAFTAGADAFTKAISDNSKTIIAFTTELATKAVPLVKDFFATLTGNDSAVVDKRFIDLRNSIVQFAKDVATVAGGLAFIFRGLASGADLVATGFNKLFGTQFSGAALIAIAVVLQFLGVFKLIGSVIGTVISGLRLVWGAIGLIGEAVGPVLEALSAILPVLVALGEAAAEFIGAIVGWPLVIIAAVVAAAVALFIFRDQVIAAAKQAWAFIVSTFSPANFAALWNAAAAGASAAWAAIVAGAGAVVTGLAAVWSSIVAAAEGAWAALVASAGAAWAALVAGAAALPGQLAGIFASIGTAIGNAITGAFNAAFNSILSLAASVASRVESIIAGINAALGQAQSKGSGGGGFAGGGLIRGPGTATSDSIPARLSNGEFVVRAAAVQQYGLNLLYAINGLRAPAKRFTDGSVGFDIGGFVGNLGNALGAGMSTPQLAFAGAGPSLAAPQRSKTPVTVVLPSGERLNFESDDATVGKIMRFGNRKATSQAGRQPGWKR